MDSVIKKSFTEAIEIINNSEKAIKDKIPQNFINLLEKNKDAEYRININEIDAEKDLLPETYAILGLIYRDFLVSKEEKKQLIENEKNIIKKYEEELSKKYSTDTLFKKHTNNVKPYTNNSV